MNCPHCRKPVPARARYCVHCGAEQEATPIAAVAAAAMGSRGRREAANAAHAGAQPDGTTHAELRASVVELPTAARAPIARDPGDPVARPAYAGAPARRGLAVGLMAACLALGVLAVAGAWWYYAPSTSSRPEVTAAPASPATAPGPSSAEQSAAPSPTSAGDSAPATLPESDAAPGASGAQAGAAEVPPSATGGTAAETPSSSSIQITPLPPPHHNARAARTEPRAAERPKAAAAPATSTAPAEPRAPAVAAAPAAAPAPVADRWSRMERELSQCTREDFVARVVCGQRVRFRYCDGYWGKVPACPGSPAVERGQ